MTPQPTQRQSPVMAQSGEIWARGLWVAIDSAKLGGLQLSKLFDDMPFDEQSARRLPFITGCWAQCEVIPGFWDCRLRGSRG